MLAELMETRKEQRQAERTAERKARAERQLRIGRVVRNLVRQSGGRITQGKIAELIHVDPTVLSAIFNGDESRVLSDDAIETIADALGVSIQQLEGEAEIPKGSGFAARPSIVSNDPAGGPPEIRMRQEAVQRAIQAFDVSNPGYLSDAERADLQKVLEATRASPSASVVQRFAQAIKQGFAAMLDQ